jgi:hypothetical protein
MTYQVYVGLMQPEREGDLSSLSGVVNNTCMWICILMSHRPFFYTCTLDLPLLLKTSPKHSRTEHDIS